MSDPPRDRWRDRIALLLWRDRDGYDPATSTVTQQHNISLRTHLRALRQRLGRYLSQQWFLSALLGGLFALAAAWLTVRLNVPVTEANQQVHPAGRELLLQCVEQRQGVFVCVERGKGDDKVIPGPDAQRLDSDRLRRAASQPGK